MVVAFRAATEQTQLDSVLFPFYNLPMSFETLLAKEAPALAAERHRMALRGAAKLLAFLQDLMAVVAVAILRSEGTLIGPAQRAALRLAVAGMSPVSQAIKALAEQLEATGPAAREDAGTAAGERDPEDAGPVVPRARPRWSGAASQRAVDTPQARAREGPASLVLDGLSTKPFRTPIPLR